MIRSKLRLDSYDADPVTSDQHFTGKSYMSSLRIATDPEGSRLSEYQPKPSANSAYDYFSYPQHRLSDSDLLHF